MWAAANSPKPQPAKKVVVKRIRLIGAAPEGFEGETVLSSTALPFEKKLVEAVGEHYERLLERIYGEDQEEKAALEDPASEVEDTAESEKYKSHKKKPKKATADLYELLGLGHLRWQATPDEIKAAYRRSALEVHPDKSETHDDTLFKAVGSAFEVLGDPKKRRDYDSADPFDDALPSADSVATDADFYKVYGAVFRNNAKWSKKTPVPDLGDDKTTYTQLEVFYTFWMRFQTWREFAQLNEYEPEQAESREEKRWMERQNAKLQAEKRKEEAARLTRLVDQAYARDPRIRARKAEQQAEKERAKQEKQDAVKRQREEVERQKLAEAEREAKAAEDAKAAAAVAKTERDKQKKVMRKKRQALRQFGDANGVNFEEIERICEVATAERLDHLLADLSDIAGTKNKIMLELDSYKSEEERKKDEDERARIERLAEQKRAEESKNAVWTNEELSLLTKALARFPGGAMNRWGQIAAYLNHTKTEAEIIAKIKSVKTKDLKDKAPATRETEDAYQRFLRDKKEATVVSSHSVRYEGSDVGPVEDAAAATPSTSNGTTSASNATSTAAPAASPIAAPVAVESPAAEAPKAATEAVKKEKAPVEWSPEQQAALEAALKKFPASTENRWDVIAAAVPGRSKKECVDRFKHLVALLKGGKK
jgi:DnaJ family protein C protein 2